MKFMSITDWIQLEEKGVDKANNFLSGEDNRVLIDNYLAAYNRFDLDDMLALVHPDIEFKNVAGGEVNAMASGINEFRQMAERSKGLFSARKQTVRRLEIRDNKGLVVEVTYEGVLAADLPNGMKKGETLRLNGRSEFEFRDGKIFRITDIS